VAFNASNLVNVAKELKAKYETTSYVICADDDRFNFDTDGTPKNAGRKYGEEAAKACLGTAVFPTFTNHESHPTDFNDLHILEGLDMVREQILGAPEVEKQYINCLGHNEDSYFYTSSSNKHIRKLTAANHTKQQLLSLMGLGYWSSIYPADNADGVDWTLAIDDLMTKCRIKGPFSLQFVRSTGLWRGDDGKLVLNTGRELVIDGKKKGFHSLKSRHIYEPADMVLPVPKRVATAEECRQFCDLLDMFRWASPSHARFLAGWLMAAPACGALRWRPHVWITGASGAGKSTILGEVVEPILSKICYFIQGQSTEAGIRQSLGNKAIPVSYDEFEMTNQKSGTRVESVIELLRQASSDNNARVMKGSADGQAIQYSCTTMAIMAAVNTNLNFEADKNRFTIIELLRHKGNKAESAAHFQEIEKMLDILTPEFVEGFYGRIIHFWPTFSKNVQTIFDQITKQYNARFGQQYSVLLAGWALCQSDRILSDDDAKFIVNSTDLEQKLQDQGEDDETDCFGYLMAKKVSIRTEHLSTDILVGELIHKTIDALQRPAGYGHSSGVDKEWVNSLMNYGMRVKGDYVYIANNHPEIKSLFRDTKWVNNYDRSLKRVAGADSNDNKSQYFGAGLSKKCTRLPIASFKSE